MKWRRLGATVQVGGAGGARRSDGSSRPPVTPQRTYLDTRARCSNHVSTPGKANQARHEGSAFWFARRPDGGNVILHHRHVRPVLIRPWSPTMEGIEGAIWASADLTSTPKIDLIECAT
jgi:hypothetical protein